MARIKVDSTEKREILTQTPQIHALPEKEYLTTMKTVIDREEVYTIGDIHGHPQEVVRELRRLNIHGAALIVLGDCGLGLGLDRLLPHLQEEAEAHDNVWYLLRGNHDNPACFTEGAETGYDRIRLLADGSRVVIHGEQGLVLGGGLSLDRGARRLGESYWPEEGLNLSVLAQAPSPLDFVLAHTAPEPPESDASAVSRCALQYHDRELLRDADEEQAAVRRALEVLRPSRWYAGHWHVHADFCVGKTRVLIHDCQELRPWRGGA